MSMIPGFEGVPIEALLAASGSMQGTLTPEGLLSQIQAENARAQADLAARTREAAGAAATAGSAYQSAAAAPPPQLDPLAQMLPQLAGNVASILSQDKSYAERAHENLKGAQDDLIRARLDNLAALKDNFDKKATAADRAGQTEESEKARMRSEQLSKTMDVLLQKQQEKAAADRLATSEAGDTERTRMNNQTQLEVARINAGARAAQSAKDTVDFLDTLVEETSDGRKYLNLTNVQSDKKTKNQALSYAKTLGIPALDKNTVDRFNTIKEVNDSMDQIDAAMSQFLPKTEGMSGGHKALERAKSAGKNILAERFQTNDQIAAFNSTSIVGIRAIQALAAGAGSGFRLNEAEVRMMMARWPKITDTYEKARQNLEWERNFLKKKMDAFFPKKQSNPGAAEDEASSFRKGG